MMSEDDLHEAELGDLPLGEGEPQPTDDPMVVLRDIKRFGFAKRPDGTLIMRSQLKKFMETEEDIAAPADDDSNEQEDVLLLPLETMAEQPASLAPPEPESASIRLAQRLQQRSQPDESKPPVDDSQDGPLKRTAFTERLRAEMGETAPIMEQPTTPPPIVAEEGWKAKPKPAAIDHARPAQQEQAPVLPEPASMVPVEPIGIVEAGRNISDDEGKWGDLSLAAPLDATAADNDVHHESHDDVNVDENADEEDDFDDVAITIGRVVSTRGSVVWGALFDDIGGHASKAARMGTLVSMSGPDSRVFGIVNGLEREQKAGAAQAERTVFEIQVLGEIADQRTGFQRGISSYPPLDAPITTVTRREINMIYARPTSSNIHIGQLRHNPKIPAFALTDSLLGKHFAVLGTTGAGKSCAVTVILQSILNEHPLGHIVLLDPHNEYAQAFGERAERLNPRNLLLPYWLLNFEEIAHILLGDTARENREAQSSLLKDAIVHAKRTFAGDVDNTSQITVDTPVPYRLSDLVATLKDGMGMLNKAEGTSRYLGLISRIESLRADKRYGFMFSSLAVKDNMEQILAQLLRIPTRGKPLTIIDISGLPSEIVDVVVSVLFRLTFELAVWSERGKAPPVLLVCEEAHRYVPEEGNIGFAPTKRVISRIAKEGRKYGVNLCLVSQRPSELAINSLAQCNTIFALRLSNENDQAFVGKTLSENSRWLVDSLPSLNTQEAVVVGDGVTVPVHIRFNDLHPDRRPGSHDPSFSKSWRQEADDTFLHQAIDRWRRQAR